MTSFSKQAQYPTKTQVFGTGLWHPTALISTKVSAVKILGLTPISEDAPQSKGGEIGDAVLQQEKNTKD